MRGTRDWGWISARVACTAGDGELASVTLALLGKGTAWVDDVSIVEYERQEPESINFGRYPPLRMRELRVETASCLAMEFIGDLDSFQAEKPSNWLVQSDDDPDFQAGIAPATIGRIRQLDNPDGTLWWNDTYRHTIFLLLPKSLTSGRHYRVVMRNVGSDREAFMLAFEERTSVSRAIKANQYGYLPNATKFAYLGDWLGSGTTGFGGTSSEFFLVDVATGRTLFRGKPQLRLRHDQKQSFSTSDQGNLTGEDVYELDFSSFQSPGEYFVVVPGVGRSLPFRVAEDIYRQPFYHCAAGDFPPAVWHRAQAAFHPIYVYDKDPVSSLSLAAVAAQLSRVLNDLGSKQDAAFYLERAEKAWTYGNSHGGEKYRIASALAAIELYRSTGKQAYHDAFLQQAPAEFETTAQERHMGHFAWSAWMSYALCAPSVADAKVQTVCRERILAAADQELKSLEQYAYRVPYTGVGGRPLRYGWGCGTNFFSGGDFSVLAWRLTGQKQYRDAALLAADYSLGCHPTGTVFITGLGQRHIQWAMHTSSNPMGVKVGRPVAETLPGIPIFGVHAYPLGFGGWQSQLLYAYADPSVGAITSIRPARAGPISGCLLMSAGCRSYRSSVSPARCCIPCSCTEPS